MVRRGLLTLSLAGACAAPAERAALPTGAPAAPATARPAAPPPPRAPAPPAVAATFPPGPDACRWQRDAWWGDISLAPGEPAVARVVGAHAAIAAPLTGRGMYVTADGDGVQIAAWISRPTLYLTRPVALAQVVYPQPWTPVAWRGLGRADALEVAIDASDTLAAPAASAEVACDAVAVTVTDFAIPVSAPAASTGGHTRTEAPLALAAGGPPVAQLRAGVGLVYGARAGASARVVVETDAYLLTGWVPLAAVQSDDVVDGLAGFGDAAPEAPRTIAADAAHPRCGRALALVIAHGGRRATIGTLAAGAPAPERLGPPDDDGFVAIRPYGAQWLDPRAGATLVADAADLDACEARRAQP
ncbi:MAG: hypothetical protein JNK64_04215 [Myxococcales bacterium]|nr:hypothetical protein [Myxococcales bacterium]